MKRQTRAILLAVFLVLPILVVVPLSRAGGALLIPNEVLSLPAKAAVGTLLRSQVKSAGRLQASQRPVLSSGAAGSQTAEVPAAPAALTVVLYDQYNNATTSGALDVTSQDFEAAFD